MKAVDVKLLDLDWIFQDGNGRKLVWMLATTQNEVLFSTKQVTTIVDLLWDKYQGVIFRKIFMPYLIYFSTALVYFTFFLREDNNNWLGQMLDFALRMLVVINMVIFEFLEIMQM